MASSVRRGAGAHAVRSMAAAVAARQAARERRPVEAAACLVVLVDEGEAQRILEHLGVVAAQPGMDRQYFKDPLAGGAAVGVGRQRGGLLRQSDALPEVG